jgi:hypothetical protein
MKIEVGDRVIVDPKYLEVLRDTSRDKDGRLQGAGIMTVEEICVPTYYETWTTYYYCYNRTGMVVCLGRKYLKKIRGSEGLFAVKGSEGGPGG